MSNEDELPEEDLDEELDDGLEDFKDEALEEDEMM